MTGPLVADTSGLLALFNRREPAHEAVRDAVAAAAGKMVVSPYVVAELDYLVATRLGVDAELAVLDELAGGAYHLAWLSREDLTLARATIDRYRDQGIGIADASLVVLADQHRSHTILTLDRRHFGVLRALDGSAFDLVP